MACNGCSGRSVPLFTKRTFSFSDLQTTTDLELIMAKQLDVGDLGDATLIVRVHSATISSVSSIVVSVYSTAPCTQEPETNFVSSLALATATVDSSHSAGDLIVDAVSPNFGGHLQIRVKGTRWSGTVEAVLSAELVLRPGAATKPKVAGDFLLDSPSPRLTVGRGTGSPRIALDKARGGVAMLALQDEAVDRWTIEEQSDEWLVVSRYNSSGTWVEDPLLIREDDGGVRGKILHYTHHTYLQSSNGYCIVPWGYVSEAYSTTNPSSFVGSYYNWGIAPFDGRLVRVLVRSDNAMTGSSSTAVALYVITEGSTTKTRRGNWIYHGAISADFTRQFDMDSNATVNKDEKIGVVVWTNGSNTHGNTQVTAIWEYDQTEGHGQVS